MAAYVDNAVFHTVQVGKGALKFTVGRTLAAHKAAGSGRRAVNGGSAGDGLGYFRMGVNVQIVVGGKIQVFLAAYERGGLGSPLVAEEKRIFHPHLGSHLHKPVKGELGTHAAESACGAFCGGSR